MTTVLISFLSLTGSPGVSTAALALTWCWPRHAVAAECDPTGGCALGVFDPDSRCGRPSVFELMLQARTTPIHRAMSGQLLILPDGTGRHHLLPGVTSPQEADSLDWQRLTSLFLELDTVDVLADCGRLRSRSAPGPVVAASDLVVVVVRNCRSSLQALAKATELIRAETGVAGDGLGVLVIDPDPRVHQRFPRGEIAKQFATAEMPVVGGLSWDPGSAGQFSELHQPGRKFETSVLLADARRTAGEIGRRAMDRMNRLRKPAPEVRHVR